MADPLLEVHEWASIPQEESLFGPVTFRLCPRDLVVCQGDSGSGKSLFLRSLVQLDACSGTMRWQGDLVVAGTLPRLRANVIYLSQRPRVTEGVTVFDALQEPFSFRIHGGRSFSGATAAELFERLDLSRNLLQASTSHLSGGELQLVALARGLLLEPQVLLLDEPSSALDAKKTTLVEACIVDWLTQGDHAAVWVTHDSQQASRIATRNLRIHQGKVFGDV